MAGPFVPVPREKGVLGKFGSFDQSIQGSEAVSSPLHSPPSSVLTGGLDGPVLPFYNHVAGSLVIPGSQAQQQALLRTHDGRCAQCSPGSVAVRPHGNSRKQTHHCLSYTDKKTEPCTLPRSLLARGGAGIQTW